jgi:dephospho-CoA kinase
MGAGKSTALKALERLGAAVQSSDTVVHELYEGATLREAVIARWGEEVAPGGVVDRAEVARRAFADEDGRAWLEATVWPLGDRRRGAVAVRGGDGGYVRRDDRGRRLRGSA